MQRSVDFHPVMRIQDMVVGDDLSIDTDWCRLEVNFRKQIGKPRLCYRLSGGRIDRQLDFDHFLPGW